MEGPYTRHPRPTMWLLPEGDLVRPGDGSAPIEVAPFYLSRSPVTNEQFEIFRPRNVRSPLSLGDDEPVAGVSFVDAVDYCRFYSEWTKRPFRLPTDHEWEFACRAVSAGRYPWGSKAEAGDAYVWDERTSGGRVHRIETKKPNAFGIHDLLGNVWEWTASGVLRGGSCRTPRRDLDPGAARRAPPDLREPDLGFRIARSL